MTNNQSPMEHERTLLQLVEELLRQLGTPASNIQISKEEEHFRIDIEAEDANLLIGYHGETMKALEHVLRLLYWKKAGETSLNLIIDIQNYRKNQEKNVLEMAEQKAEMTRRTGKTQILPPMSPYFRRLVHVHLTQTQFKDLETFSVGEGDRRQITIKIKENV